MKNKTLFNIVKGQLKSVMQDYRGPITKQRLGMAATRVEHAITGHLSDNVKRQYEREWANEYVWIKPSELKRLKQRKETQAKTIRDLLKILKDNGIVLPQGRDKKPTETSD